VGQKKMPRIIGSQDPGHFSIKPDETQEVVTICFTQRAERAKLKKPIHLLRSPRLCGERRSKEVKLH
jgi:hypothetical protein